MIRSSAAGALLRIGCKAALVADIGVVTARRQFLLQGVEDSDPMRTASREGRRAHRHDHEFLEVDRIVGVRAAIDDVHHRNREQPRIGAADIAVRAAGRRIARRRGQRRATRREMGVGAEIDSCWRRPSSSIIALSSAIWPSASMPQILSRSYAIDRGDGALHALAEIAGCRHRAVRPPSWAPVERLTAPWRGPSSRLPDARRPRPSGFAAVEDFASDDIDDGGHDLVPSFRFALRRWDIAPS